jgi:hypothetical protein
MTKRVAVGPKNRRGIRINGPDGKLIIYRRGALLPEGTELPPRYFRDKRAVWVDDVPVKKERHKPTPKTEEADKSATPSPSSGGAGASAPAPLEVTDKGEEPKKKRRRKKLFNSE